jgi:hypothetical protein
VGAPAARSNGHEPHETHLGFIHIDSASMYQQVNNDRLAMVRVETTLNNVQTQVNTIDTRLRALEPKVWAIPAAGTVIAAAALIIALWGKFGG